MPKTISVAVPEACTLCPRQCKADRAAGQTGFCGAGRTLKAARAALHFWEEPCISGTRGSGTVFFSEPDLTMGMSNSAGNALSARVRLTMSAPLLARIEATLAKRAL